MERLPRYFTTLPIKAIVAELRAAGIPASVSQTAGTFVCNHLFFGLMHHITTRRPCHAWWLHSSSIAAGAGCGHRCPSRRTQHVARYHGESRSHCHRHAPGEQVDHTLGDGTIA